MAASSAGGILREPLQYLLGVRVGWEHRIEDVLDRARAHDECQALEQEVVRGAERRQLQRPRQAQFRVGNQEEREVQAADGFPLALGVLGGEADDVGARQGEVRVVVAEAACLLRASARTGDEVPVVGELGRAGRAGSRVGVDDGPLVRPEVGKQHAAAVARGQRDRRNAQPGQMGRGTVVARDGQAAGQRRGIRTRHARPLRRGPRRSRGPAARWPGRPQVTRACAG